MATLQNYPVKLVNGGSPSVSIAAGQSPSTSLCLLGASILGFLMPPNLTACNFTFNASLDGVNFYSLVDAYTNNPISIFGAAGNHARVYPNDFVGVNYIQMISSVTQAQAVSIGLVAGPIL